MNEQTHICSSDGNGHTSGLRLLRVAARARAEHGRAAVGSFYETVSGEIFDGPGAEELTPATRASVCSPAQPEKRRTGTPAAARRHRSLGEATGVELHGKAAGDLPGG
jgi:hypothetical protein